MSSFGRLVRLFRRDSLFGSNVVSSWFARAVGDCSRDFRDDFLFWRAIWRSTSDLSLATELESSAKQIFDVEAESASAVELEFFLLQGFVARRIRALLSILFDLTSSETKTIFGSTPFDRIAPDFESEAAFAADVRAEASRIAVALDADRTLDPFSEYYANLFSAQARRRLGEFYTPKALAEYLFDRATSSRAADGASFPTTLDPTCGGGVFLTVALRRRLAALDRFGDFSGRFSDVATNANARVEAVAAALNDLAGFDLSPLAVLTARANLAFAATSLVPASRRGDELRRVAEIRTRTCPNASIFPIFLFDAILDRVPASPEPFSAPDSFESTLNPALATFERRFDLAIGNPPWLAWDATSPEYRAATAALWRKYGLFSLSGTDARLGGGKKEFASLAACATLDKRLNDGGVLAFVVPKSLFQTRKAGDGFRRFGWNANPDASDSTDFNDSFDSAVRYSVFALDDLSALDVFPSVSSRAATFCARKGEATVFPIPARRLRPADADSASRRRKAPFDFAALQIDEGAALPVSNALGAPLRFDFAPTAPDDAARSPKKSPDRPSKRRFDRLAPPTDDSRRRDALVERLLDVGETGAYVARLGANAAGASGVFWLEGVSALSAPLVAVRNLGDVGRTKVETVEAEVESALVFPLLRWRDVDEYVARVPTTAILLPQDPIRRRGYDEETMRRDYPAALARLRRFESVLRARAAYRKFQNRAPFWSLYNVDVETFAPIKVVWRRMDSALRAAAVPFDVALGRPIVPQETLSTVAVGSLDEADYLVAVLNSAPVRRRVASSSVAGSKSFGSPGLLSSLPIPKFDVANELCAEIAAFGRERRLERASDGASNR